MGRSEGDVDGRRTHAVGGEAQAGPVRGNALRDRTPARRAHRDRLRIVDDGAGIRIAVRSRFVSHPLRPAQ